MKTLIAYFSCPGQTETDHQVIDIEKGHVEIVAEKMQKLTGADLYKIEPAQPYPLHYNDIVARARQEHENGLKVEIKHPLQSIDEYDKIYLGFPIWYKTFPRIIRTFVTSYNWSDKTIIPFCCNDECFWGFALNELEKTVEPGKLVDGLSIRGIEAYKADEQIKAFVEKN